MKNNKGVSIISFILLILIIILLLFIGYQIFYADIFNLNDNTETISNLNTIKNTVDTQISNTQTSMPITENNLRYRRNIN